MSDDLYKVVIIGNSGVGKSNLMTRYTQNEFSADSPSTIGVEFMTKSVKVDQRDVKVQIWDTAGQERFRAISRSIYHGAKGAMVVYDITNEKSFEDLDTWLQELRVHVHASTVIFLIGNKCDLEHMRVVKKERADRFAREHGMSFLETSAAERTNVDKAFEWLVKSMHDQNLNGPMDAGATKPSAAKPAATAAPVNMGAAKPAASGGSKGCKC